MADTKITALTANTTPVSTDILLMVDDPGGTPLGQKITLQSLKDYFCPSGQIYGLTMSNAADTLNERRLEVAVKELEPIFGHELRYAGFSTPEFRYRLTVQDRLLSDTLDFPHRILLDRTKSL
mgnify:CR=1 FL=1